MPELPEVETVRAGLAAHITGNVFTDITVLKSRSIRQHVAGSQDFAARLRGQTIHCVSRRGKYLWLPLHFLHKPTGEALVMHLGMSGQALLCSPHSDPEKQLRVRLGLNRDDVELRFVDQRMFGGMHIDELKATDHGQLIPQSVSHISRDLLDPLLDRAQVIANIRRRTAGIKQLILNQQVVSGIGNIYADEALWRAKIHYATPGNRLSTAKVADLLDHAHSVMTAAVKVGGTSFDDLYVNVNGESGWFELSLNAYGQEGQPCTRCGRPIVRESWSNRSSFRCPRCQPRPRA